MQHRIYRVIQVWIRTNLSTFLPTSKIRRRMTDCSQIMYDFPRTRFSPTQREEPKRIQNLSSIAHFRCIKIESKTKGIIPRLWGINSYKSLYLFLRASRWCLLFRTELISLFGILYSHQINERTLSCFSCCYARTNSFASLCDMKNPKKCALFDARWFWWTSLSPCTSHMLMKRNANIDVSNGSPDLFN